MNQLAVSTKHSSNIVNKGIIYLNKTQIDSIDAKIKDCCVIHFNNNLYVATIWVYPLSITNTLNKYHAVDDLTFITHAQVATSPLINSDYQIFKVSKKLVGKVQTVTFLIDRSELNIQQSCYLKSILIFRYVSNNGTFKFNLNDLKDINLTITNISISSNHKYGVILSNTHIVFSYTKPKINAETIKLYGTYIKNQYSSISESIDLHIKSNLSLFAILSGPEGVGKHSLLKNISIERQLTLVVNPDLDNFLDNKSIFSDTLLIFDENFALNQSKSLIYVTDNNKSSKVFCLCLFFIIILR